MKQLLKKPAVNAVCIGMMTAFYTTVFLLADFSDSLYYGPHTQAAPFWSSWSDFLSAGHHKLIALALVAVTLIVILLLANRHKNYDEYHVARLIVCFVVSLALTLIAIAGLYLILLADANGVIEKLTLFVTVNWGTVVVADLVFVLLCRQK